MSRGAAVAKTVGCDVKAVGGRAARMTGKAAKVAVRVAQGDCRISVVSANGMAEGGFGTMGGMGKMLPQQGKVTAAMLHGMFVTARASEEMARTTASGVHKVVKAHSEDENE